MLDHLDKTAPYWASQVAEARSRIAAVELAPHQEQGASTITRRSNTCAGFWTGSPETARRVNP